jgi:hypothetical protein
LFEADNKKPEETSVRYPDRRLASIIAATLLTAACSKQSANKRNFKAAIQAA